MHCPHECCLLLLLAFLSCVEYIHTHSWKTTCRLATFSHSRIWLPEVTAVTGKPGVLLKEHPRPNRWTLFTPSISKVECPHWYETTQKPWLPNFQAWPWTPSAAACRPPSRHRKNAYVLLNAVLAYDAKKKNSCLFFFFGFF